MPSATAFLDQTPPSSNTNTGVGGRGNPKAIARTKSEWEGLLAMLLLMAKVPRRLEKITVKPTLQFRTKGRRDADNMFFPIAKPLGDALVKGGWLEDDDYSRYICERVDIQVGFTDLPPLAKGRTTLVFSW